jgi:tellurite resistance protein TerC
VETWMPWLGFGAFVIGMLALDLGVFHRKSHEIHMKEALLWSAVWITLALLFNGLIYLWKGPQAGMEFLTGYLIEKSLSVDNVFVFVMIFSYFSVPAAYQHRVLFWGILGALAMRAIFIAGGVALIKNFHWIIYVFGAFLILTAIKMAFQPHGGGSLDKNPAMKLIRRFVPTTDRYDGQKFWTLENGRKVATPLFAALLLVEFTDVIFAVDSIPAILAITNDPFIVYTSNVFAILGLRSLYFALAGVVKLFRFLHYGLALILGFVGTKMLIVDFYKVPIGLSLGVIATILTLSVIVSIAFPKREPAQETAG